MSMTLNWEDATRKELLDEDSILCWDQEPRFLFSWRDDPLKKPSRRDPNFKTLYYAWEDSSHMDRLCRVMSGLPSMRGMVEACPQVAEIGLYKSWDDDDSSGAWYNSDRNEADLNASAKIPPECLDDYFYGFIAHELRHGFQKHNNCFIFRQDSFFKDDVEYHVLFNRFIEGDCTVASIVSAVEIGLEKNNWNPLKAIRSYGRRETVAAYMREIKKDPQSHWDGEAAKAALLTYLSNKNAKLQKKYEDKVCELFTDVTYGDELQEDVDCLMDKLPAFLGHIAPMKSMPYIGKNGQLIERERYKDAWKITRPMLYSIASTARKNVQEIQRKAVIDEFATAPRL